MYYTYILKSQNYHKTYIGITNNLKKRLSQHNKGLSSFTRRYKPWSIIYKEILPDKKTARKREIYLKSTQGRRWIKKQIFDNLTKTMPRCWNW